MHQIGVELLGVLAVREMASVVDDDHLHPLILGAHNVEEVQFVSQHRMLLAAACFLPASGCCSPYVGLLSAAMIPLCP